MFGEVCYRCIGWRLFRFVWWNIRYRDNRYSVHIYGATSAMEIDEIAPGLKLTNDEIFGRVYGNANDRTHGGVAKVRINIEHTASSIRTTCVYRD